MSTLFYYGAFCVFHLPHHGILLFGPRALAVLALFGGALLPKQTAIHTSAASLLVFTDLCWVKGEGLRANQLLYRVMWWVCGVAGLVFVWRSLRTADNTILHVQGMTPFTYFLTESRVLWTYVRLFFLPAGQNADPEVAVSHGLLDQGAIVALAAWLAVGAAAWIYRKRWPLAAFGLGVFLLLLAPTSSVIPIAPMSPQERRLYSPFLGLTLVQSSGFLQSVEASAAPDDRSADPPIPDGADVSAQRDLGKFIGPVARYGCEIPSQSAPAFSARLRALRDGTVRRGACSITTKSLPIWPRRITG